jgi:hypothetical protein
MRYAAIARRDLGAAGFLLKLLKLLNQLAVNVNPESNRRNPLAGQMFLRRRDAFKIPTDITPFIVGRYHFWAGIFYVNQDFKNANQIITMTYG